MGTGVFRADAQDPPEQLWHYTSQAGLEGIIKDLSLRATLAMLTNDREEMLRGIKVVEKEVAAATTESERSSLPDLLRVDDDYFVTCFTEVCDGASMWQHYGQEGYAVVFDRIKLDTALSNQDVELMKVVYDEGGFRRSLRDALDASLTDTNSKWSGASLNLRHAGLKGSEWSGEQEWRLAAQHHIRCGLGNGDEHCFSTAPSKFGPRPYVDLHFGDRSCIDMIVAGPGPYLEERAESAKWLLRQHGFPPMVDESRSTLRP